MNICKLVLKNIFRRKGRFAFTLLGITVGMASFVALLSLGGSMRGEVTRQAQAMGANFMIMPENICIFNQIAIVTGDTISESLQYEIFEKISKIEGLIVIPHLTQKAAVKDIPSVIVGILPEETWHFREWEMIEGGYFNSQNENEVIVGKTFAEKRNLSVGEVVNIRAEQFTIKGILKPNQSNDDAAMFMPLIDAQNITALENIETAMMFGKIPHKEQRKKAEELLALVGLSDKANTKPNEMSGGQQQRVSIARSLANDPDILLMDEPTGNLDSESEKSVLEHIFKIHKTGKTIVIVTHNSELADKAEIIFEIKDGKLKH